MAVQALHRLHNSMVTSQMNAQVTRACLATLAVRTIVWVDAAVLLLVVVHAALTSNELRALRTAVLSYASIIQLRYTGKRTTRQTAIIT